ncbi:Alpha/Beta hydrolase protein [Desarmillaria tabescens]|uniref:GPI inositol-deacylase n=1 Tax=Armillaria tabescens TaxID=1929756 RepID=A0AA39NGG4_ARMTA|nr:Alpha/Beta hydrolase protein [Desarmillaria tabescens]KAK0465008.1 Alpha/Beta hydrolase protein [Desarmillaria tabescens]
MRRIACSSFVAMPSKSLKAKTTSHAPSTSSSTFRKSSQPVVRWLETWSPYHNSGSSKSTASSQASSPASSRSSTPPSPALASLNEALHESLRLPTRPPLARLPTPLYTSRLGHGHSPQFFDNLTRTTLPTSSLSIESQLNYSSSPISSSPISSQSSIYQQPAILGNSPTHRTSLDTLRSVSQRDYRRSSHSQSISSERTSTFDSTSWPKNWWWFQSENKEDVDGMLGEDDRADTVEEERDRIRKKYRSPKNPIVFCHGLLGFDSVTIGPAIAPLQVTHWRGIKEVLEANGSEVLITRVPATSTPIDRAKVLEEKISAVYPGRSVHLIGHSMGGLDCRYLTSKLTHRNFSVLSITTIGTPHRGSAFADHFLTTLGKSRMPSFLQFLDMLPNGGGDGKAFEFLTLENMRRFNEEVKDVDGVQYFSWGAVYDPGFVDTWKWSHSVVLEKEGPNDGLVSVNSAKWGTYLGTLEDVNHLDLVGWINAARYKWAEMTGRQINFRPATFYLGVADMLAERVEGQPKLLMDEGCSNAHPSSGEGNKAGSGATIKEDSNDQISINKAVTMTTGEDVDGTTGNTDGQSRIGTHAIELDNRKQEDYDSSRPRL